MAKPVNLPRWADLADPADIVEPTEGRKNTGWLLNDIPPHSYFNWWKNLVYLWILWIRGKFDTIPDVKDFGALSDGATNDAVAINAMIASIGATPTTIMVTGQTVIQAAVSFPATTEIYFARGGSFDVRAGGAVTFSGHIRASMSQIFLTSGGGTLSFAARVAEIRPEWWGAKADGATDCTAAFQSAIKAAGQAFASSDWFSVTNPTTGTPVASQIVTLAGGGTYKISGGPVLVPQGVAIDGRNATIIGSGHAIGSNTIFESGYFSAGALVTNWGQTPESHRLVATRIRNIRFAECGLALNLYNFNEGSSLENLTFYGCYQSFNISRGFYSRIHNLYSRWPVAYGANTKSCYALTDQDNVGAHTGGPVDNVISLDSVFSDGGGRSLAFFLDGGVSGLLFQNCSAENGVDGIRVQTECNPMSIRNCYFENLTGTAIDLTYAAAKRAIDIDDNWFTNIHNGGGTAIAIAGIQLQGGVIGAGNYFDTNGTGVDKRIVISDDTTSAVTVRIMPQRTYANAAPSLTALGYYLGKMVKVECPLLICDPGTGLPVARADWTGNLVDLFYGGKSGFVASGIPLCTFIVNPTTVIVDTQIVADRYVIGAFNVTVPDNTALWGFRGRFYGDGLLAMSVVLDGTTNGSRTCAASVNGSGNVRLTFGNFDANASAPEGVIRIM